MSTEIVAQAIARVRDDLLATYGWTHVDVELARIDDGGIVLRGTVAAPRAIARLREAIAAALPGVRVEADAIGILRTHEFVLLVEETTELWRRPDRGALATELARDDGPVEALAREGDATLVRAKDGTLGWTHAPLGPRCEPPRLPAAHALATGELLARAAAWIDAPYRLGGTRRAGVDCSGLVQRLLGAIGALVPRHSADQLAIDPHAGAGQGDAGDLVALWSSDEAPCHVGLALGDDNVVHASRSQSRVVIEPLDGWRARARRLAHVPIASIAELQARAAGTSGLGDVLPLGRDE